MSRRNEPEDVLNDPLKLKRPPKGKLIAALKRFVDGDLDRVTRYLPKAGVQRWLH